MRIKRIHFFLALLVLVVCAIPFRATVRRIALSMVQIAKGRKTVADRLQEYGGAARSRLAPDFAKIGCNYPPQKIVLLGLKQEKLLEVWVSNGSGALKHLKTYPILAASGKAGPKLAEGDLQVPEGIYEIESLNPNSSFHLSLRVAYPNTFDREKGRLDGRVDLGSDIMIHGKAASIGCLAIGDPAIEELFVLVAETGVNNVKVILSPIDLRTRELPANEQTAIPWITELYADIKSEIRNLSK